MKADLSPGLQRKAFMAENIVTTPLRHKECFTQMSSKPRIPITADGKKARVFDTGSTRSLKQKPSSMNSVAFRLHSSTMAT